jgi:acyl-CoA synthetase (AMP-forming)/AMP-acid ligase II
LVSWLPLFHDMGLVFGMVAPLTIGAQVTLLTPFAFVQQPSRWLRLLTEQRATHTMSPNFGLDLCVDRVAERQRAGLDLSALTVLGNGAEPVRSSTLDRFTEAFAPHGFRHAAHTAGYGLAEATLVVAAQPTEADPVVRHFDRDALAAGRVREDPAGHPMVDCGPPVLQEVRIVDPGTGSPCPPGTVGEIWVRGENTCAGYWNDPEQTAQTFDATLCGESGWLRTGDLGFRHEGGLFIAGRVKDVIIVDGRNLYPVDIELAVEESCPTVRRGHVAAFSVDTPRGERIVVVAEPGTREPVDLEVLRRDVRTAVGTRFDVDVHDVVLIRRGTLPKTSSGKLRRRHCGQLYQRGQLTVPHGQVSA